VHKAAADALDQGLVRDLEFEHGVNLAHALEWQAHDQCGGGDG
jgi:hypothetical protein